MKSGLSVNVLNCPVFHLNESILEYVISCIQNNGLKNIDLENRVLAISSKLVSLAEGRVVNKAEVNKTELIKKESDYFLGEMSYGCFLTIKHGHLIATAGINETNSEGNWYILLPEKPLESASLLCIQLKVHFGLKNFGIVLTDSRTSPLRVGVTGIALAHSGFKGVRSCVGEKDLFGRELKLTQIAVVDALATSAVYCMGEGSESTPLSLIHCQAVEFTNRDDPKECQVSLDQDIYSPYYKGLLKK
jgi:F420-0:gamma-glutamyl ligase